MFCGVVKKAEKCVKISVVSDHKWTHPLNINGSILPVKIDTGAGSDLMNYNDFLSLKNRPRLKHSNVLLSDYNDNNIKVKGCCVLYLRVRGVQQPVRFIVVSDGPSLLGCDTSERLDLVRRVYNVDMKECVSPENQNILNCLPFQCKIKLKEKSEPVIHAARRVHVILRDKLKVELERMVKLGVIHSVDYPIEWVNSMVITQKPNGDLRI